MYRDSCFRKCERLRKNKEILTVLRKGRKYPARFFILYICPGSKPWSRFAVSVPKKTGKAVTRNRIKRYFREYFRLHKDILSFPSDIFVVALPSSAEISFHEGIQDYLSILQDYYKR